MNICDMSIRAYREKVVPGSRKDALAVLLASTEDPDSPLTEEELVGAASIFLGTRLALQADRGSRSRRCGHDSCDACIHLIRTSEAPGTVQDTARRTCKVHRRRFVQVD